MKANDAIGRDLMDAKKRACPDYQLKPQYLRIPRISIFDRVEEFKVSRPTERVESFNDSVVEAFERGSKRGLVSSNLFEKFGSASNPFDPNILIGNPDLIIEKIKTVLY